MRLFWEQPEDMHLTMPLRKLVDFTLGMVTGLNRNSEAEVRMKVFHIRCLITDLRGWLRLSFEVT